MSNENDRVPVFVGVNEQVPNFLSVFSIEIPCGLISYDKFWIMNHGSSDGYFLFLAPGNGFVGHFWREVEMEFVDDLFIFSPDGSFRQSF